MPTTKQEFLERPRYAGLSNEDKEARWKQHLVSERETSSVKRLARSATTNVGRSRAVTSMAPDRDYIPRPDTDNWYLKTLLDAEACKGHGVPDLASTPSYKFQSIQEIDVAYVDNRFSVVAYPDIDAALTQMTSSASSAGLTLVGPVWSIGVDTGFGIQQPILVPQVLKNGKEFRIKGRLPGAMAVATPWTILECAPIPIAMAAFVDHNNVNGDGLALVPHIDQGKFFGWPMQGPDSFSISSDGNLGTGVNTFTMGVNDINGNALPDITTTFTFPTTGNNLHGIVNTTAAFAAWTGWTASMAYIRSISMTHANGSSMRKIAMFYLINAGSPTSDPVGLVATSPILDLASVLDNFSAIRPVSGSMLITYQGDVTKGGQIASRLYPSVESPFDGATPSLTYGEIASRPGSFSGSLRHGTYVVWAPQSNHDTEYRRLQSDVSDDTAGTALYHEGYSFMVAAGNTASSADATARVRIVWNWELLTTTQLFGTTPSPVNPELIWSATSALSGFPTAMPNDSHLEMIGKFLQKGAKWAWRNKDKIRQLMAAPDLASLGANIIGLS